VSSLSTFPPAFGRDNRVTHGLAQAATFQIQFQFARADYGRRRPLATGSAQDRAYPGDQFTQVEGLSNVVIGSRLECQHLVVLAIAHREHHDARLRPSGANPAARFEPADPLFSITFSLCSVHFSVAAAFSSSGLSDRAVVALAFRPASAELKFGATSEVGSSPISVYLRIAFDLGFSYASGP